MLSLVLFFIAYFIFMGMAYKRNMWWLIVVYWAAVTLKNLFDCMGV